MQQFRRLAKVTDKSVIIDENEIDIYEYDETPIPDWKPSVTLKPLEQVSKLYLDIETTGLDPDKDDIVLIGLMNEAGKSHIIDCLTDGEYFGLVQFIEILNLKKPEILCTFNGFKFDLPFIINKLNKYGAKHGFYTNKKRTKVFRTAQMFSVPTEYNDIWLNNGNTAIIDLFHQSLAWDYVNHKLTRYGLKHIPNQLNLPGYENDKPIELSYSQMQQAIANWDVRSPTKGVTGKELLTGYLKSDLKATKAIGDFLLPDIYYQKLILPDWNLQSLATSGNGSKWNDILKQHYAKYGGITTPQTSPKLSFVGGLTGSKPGLFRNIAKIDVASLYPSIMLLYGVCSDKDPDRHCLAVLKFLRTERLRLKKIASDKKGTPEGLQAKQAQGALKVLINSGYGFLSTGFIEYNDFVAGAGVTAHGRAILRKMMASLEDCGMINACFSGDTKVMTDAGDFKIIDILDKPVKVLNINGDWVPTVFRQYGRAKLWEVTVKRNRETVTYKATKNHRWYVREKNGSINVYTTDKLKPVTKESGSGAKLPHIMPVNPDMNFQWQEGFLHGVVYGDGSLSAKNQDGRYRLGLTLYGEKAELADKFFYSAYSTVINQSTDKRHAGSVSLTIKSSVNYKELPHPASDDSYLYGFIAGLVATDGSVNTKKTGVRICGTKETVEYVASIANRCGLNVNNIAVSNYKHESGYSTTKTDTWYISFETSTVEKEMLERKFHRDKFEPSTSNPDWRVISVVETDVVENVYCCVEPITNTFVLSTGCITGNSVDTDGIYYASDDPTFAKNKEAWKYCQSKMPKTIELEYELEAMAMYCPPNEDNSEQGLRKNYVYVYRDEKSGDIKVKSKGKFVKRDKCYLEKHFIPEIVKRYATDGTHEKYYKEVLSQLLTGIYPVEKLATTRKIKANEKRLVELGLGQAGDAITIYKAKDKILYGKRGQALKKGEIMWTKDPSEIDWTYYVGMLNDMWEQFLKCPKY